MSTELHHIPKICKNAGGILGILYFNMTNVSLTGLGLQTGDIQFVDPTQIWSLQFRKNKAQYTERPAEGKGGMYWTQSLVAEVPRARFTVEGLVQKIRNQRIGLLYIDRNGFQRYLLGMKLSIAYESGKRRSDTNGYEIKFSKKYTKSNDYIAGQIDIGVFDGGDIGGGGNYDDINMDKYYTDLHSGMQVTLPFMLPTDDDVFRKKTLIFRDGVKMILNHTGGFSRTGSTLTFNDPLDGETIEAIYRP